MQQELAKHTFQSMVTFGGCRDDFMIVLSRSVTKEVLREQGTEKLLFSMTKTKVLVEIFTAELLDDF